MQYYLFYYPIYGLFFFQVVCMTPAIFDNNVRKEFITFSNVSLLIFDECHHTQSEHPYNKIMGKYVDIKLMKKERPKATANVCLKLPQVSNYPYSTFCPGYYERRNEDFV